MTTVSWIGTNLQEEMQRQTHHGHGRWAALPLLLLGGGSILILKLEFQEEFLIDQTATALNRPQISDLNLTC